MYVDSSDFKILRYFYITNKNIFLSLLYIQFYIYFAAYKGAYYTIKDAYIFQVLIYFYSCFCNIKVVFLHLIRSLLCS